MSYTPKEGSVAARAIAFMEEMADTEATTSVIGEAIDAEPGTVQMSLAAAIRAGVVSMRKVGRNNWLSLGGTATGGVDDDDDAPPQRTGAATEADPANASIFARAAAVPLAEPVARVKRAYVRRAPLPAKAKPAKAKPAKKTRRTPPPKAVARKSAPGRALTAVAGFTPRIAELVIEPQPRGTGAPPSLGCALFNTGDLLLEVPGASALRLTREQTQDLLAYLLQRSAPGRRAPL